MAVTENIQQGSSVLKPPANIKYKRVKTPTLIQMEAVECGAAALGIMLRHYGKYVPLEELRVKTGVSRDGSKASHVVTAARGYGFDVKGLRKEPEELYDLEPPFIVFWNFNHFLVVEGFGKDKVYLNNPASGPETVSYEEFNNSFTGVVIDCRPGPDFKKGGKPPSVYRSLMQRMVGSWSGIIYAILAGLALVIPGLMIPVFSKLFVDNILISKMHHFLIPLLEGMALTAVLRAALSYAQSYYLVRLEDKLSLSMTAKFTWHIIQLPFSFFTQRYAGDVSSRIALNESMAQILSGQVVHTFINLFMIIFYAALMFIFNVPLTLIVIIFGAVNIIALKNMLKQSSDVNMRLANETGKFMSTSVSGLFTIETLKASGTESDFFSRWAGVQAKLTNAQQQLSTYTRVISVVPTVISTLATATILGVGGFYVLDGQISLGTLVAFQTLMASFMGPLQEFMGIGSQIQQVEASLRRLDDVYDYPIENPKAINQEAMKNPGELTKLTGAIEFQDITFGYNILEPPLIEGFNLNVKPGSRVALVGGSGSGKSTTANLLTGLYQPWSGKILFDGKTHDEIPDNVLASSISVVSQDINLFEGTIKENVALWDPSISKTKVIEASKDAAVHDHIEARPGGYDGNLEEGGRNFSGGEKQRIEIARAIVGDPSILIMDEATSALDPETEKIIDENIRRRGCTCVIVAHRLSTIRDCDEIIVLENGKIVERGTHESMKDAGGPYSQLIHTQ